MVTLAKEIQPEVLNAIVNSEDVFSHVAIKGQTVIDMACLLKGRNVALLAKEGDKPVGFFLFEFHYEGAYEVHTCFLKCGRGSIVLSAARMAIEFMFTKTDCEEVRTKCPDGNKPASALIGMMGFMRQFYRPACHPKVDGSVVGVWHYSLPFSKWVMDADGLLESGEWFHEKIKHCGKQMGLTLADHEHDESHERYAGAALKMAASGRPSKAVHLYNRWARFSGYHPIKIVSKDPLKIDIRDCVVCLQNGEITVEALCQ